MYASRLNSTVLLLKLKLSKQGKIPNEVGTTYYTRGLPHTLKGVICVRKIEK